MNRNDWPGDSDRPTPTPPLVGALLDHVLAPLGAPPARALTAATSRWSEIIGEEFEHVASLVRIDAEELVIETPDPGWASRLAWQESTVLERCEQVAGTRPSRLVVRVARQG